MAFDIYAGQSIAEGIGKNLPMATLEENYKTNIETINGLLPKISRVFFDETRVFGDPMASLFVKTDEVFGAGVEFGAFVEGSPNKKKDGTCFPKGGGTLVSQVAYTNYAYSNDITLYDYEINKAVFTPEEAGSYFANKLLLPRKTESLHHYVSGLQLLSGVIDGSRTITSTSSSDGTGAEITYTADVVGYAGKVNKSSLVIPAPVEDSLTTITADDASGFALTLEGVAADMQYESKTFSKLGVSTFAVGKPYVIAEKKTLNALDNCWMVDGAFKGFPTKTARDFIRMFADIVEINKFPELPTATGYDAHRIGAIMLDKSACREFVKYANVESDRCVKERATGYNFQGESIMTISKTLPSYALLVKGSAV